MGERRNYTGSVIITAFVALFSLLTYAKHWESKQPKQKIEDAVVKSIEPYNKTNDAHWNSYGFRAYLIGQGISPDKAVDFPLKNWDDTVQEDDTVDAVVRRSFPWFGAKDELDGLAINDYKN